MTSRRVHGLAANRSVGGESPLANCGMQNSQRVLLVRPRIGVGSRHVAMRHGCQAAREGGTGRGRGGAGKETVDKMNLYSYS